MANSEDWSEWTEQQVQDAMDYYGIYYIGKSRLLGGIENADKHLRGNDG